MSGLDFKVRVDSLFMSFFTCVQYTPQILLWCDTCSPLIGQHCNRAFFIHVLVHIHKHWLVSNPVPSAHQSASSYRLSHSDLAKHRELVHDFSVRVHSHKSENDITSYKMYFSFRSKRKPNREIRIAFNFALAESEHTLTLFNKFNHDL